MKRLLCGLAIALGFSMSVLAQGFDIVPLHQAGVDKCVLKAGHDGRQVTDYQCIGVGDLYLAPKYTGTSFWVRVRVDAPTKLRLPGQEGGWPSDVKLNGQQALLRNENGQWYVVLGVGNHRIEGYWNKPIERVGLGQAYARVIWEPENRELSQKQGFAWIGAEQEQTRPQDQDTTPKLRVWRKLEDGQVPRLTTQIELRISGPTQKLTVGPILPEGFTSTHWNADLPMVMTPENKLVVVGSQGLYRLSIHASCRSCATDNDGNINGLALPTIGSPWPAQETWTVVEQRDFRSINVEGSGVDPAMAQVPSEWQSWPAFRVSAQERINIQARSRGIHHPTDLAVSRKSWWTNSGWIHYDNVLGTAPAGIRLSMDAPYNLGWIEENGIRVPITQDGKGSGISWPQGKHMFAAQLSQNGYDSGLGWNQKMKEETRTVHLPPGMALARASGYSSVRHASSVVWTDRFTLLSWFSIAILAMLVRQSSGWIAATIAAILAMGWIGTGGAVLLLWLIAFLSITSLLAQALPQGKLVVALGLLRKFLAAVLLVAFLPFAGEQMRLILHPQLDNDIHQSYSMDPGVIESSHRVTYSEGISQVASDRAMPAMATTPEPSMKIHTPQTELDGLGLASVGEPLPTWNKTGIGKNYVLDPVGKPGVFIVLGTATVALLRLVGVLLFAWLVARLTFMSWPIIIEKMNIRQNQIARTLALAMLLAPSLGMAQDKGVVAQSPTQAKELAAPECAPNCASLVAANLEVNGEQILATYRLSVEHPSAWNLPHIDGARMVDIVVDGQPGWWIQDNQVRLNAGQARVTARYKAETDQVEIRMAPAPLSLTHSELGWTGSVSSDGSVWTVAKIDKGQTQDSELTLPAAPPAPAMVHIQRNFSFMGTVSATYVIERLPGNEGSLTVWLQALDGETMQTEGVIKQEGQWVGNIPAGQRVVVWNSQIQTKGDLAFDLKAIPASVGQETWMVDHSPAWEVAFEGPDTQRAGQRLPLPGESFKLKAKRLPMAPGNNQRVDQARWDVEYLDHSTVEHTITLDLTLAQAEVRTIKIPTQARIHEVLIDGNNVVVQPQDGKLDISIPGGKHELRLKLRVDQQKGVVQKLPEIDLGGPVNNLAIHYPAGKDRWLLAAWGPGWGPAVMYWSELVVLLGVALILARLPFGISTISAVLLVLGMSTQEGTAMWLTMLVIWLAGISYRERISPQQYGNQAFNLIQIGMVVLTMLVSLTVSATIARGLLVGQPDMSIVSPGTGEAMTWWVDRTQGVISSPVLVSVPRWGYKVLLFAWTLWFATWLWGIIKRALAAWMNGGYWYSTPPQPPRLPDPPQH